MRIGIFFGGFSREREISFAGGRTVYDNLNRYLFEPIPIFVDSFGNFILLDWEYLYKGSIRDFYPHPNLLKSSSGNFQLYCEHLGDLNKEQQLKFANEIGLVLQPNELQNHINFAFLALHGKYGEDGIIQGQLEALQIPYSGSGILPSSIGIDKGFQKQLMANSEFDSQQFISIPKHKWDSDSTLYKEQAIEKIGFPMVSRPAHQGSSIGVRLINDAESFDEAINEGFFRLSISKAVWSVFNEEEQYKFIERLTDIRSEVGLPLLLNNEIVYHPDNLLKKIIKHFSKSSDDIQIQAIDSESHVLVEPFIDGREFSVIVVRNENGEAKALPPTEIIKGSEIFDYRSKYLPGLSRKQTPIDLPIEKVQAIQKASENLFNYFNFNVYARIDGFLSNKGEILLNDPNTTSGMLPSSFFFHQAAEIGLNPSQFLTFIIRQSLFERIESGSYTKPETKELYNNLNQRLDNSKQQENKYTNIAVILGGYSAERHISVESGRNIYEKLASSSKYDPIPIFLTKSENGDIELYKIPINILLKDNADDIKDKIKNYKLSPVIEAVRNNCKAITDLFSESSQLNAPQKISFEELKSMVDIAFIALHGRPGEDGSLQQILEQYDIPYNGSSPATSQITINKYKTNQMLADFDFSVPNQMLIFKDNWFQNVDTTIDVIESNYKYPFIAKPCDDGCSAAVKKIDDKQELIAFANSIFREEEKELTDKDIKTLGLKPKEEFPVKSQFLIENLIQQKEAVHFLEVTVGILTESIGGGMLMEVFEPSEVLSVTDVLSLEEKFLAGEGQNITPARFHIDPIKREEISSQVRADIKRVAETLNIEGYARIDAFVKIYEDNSVETIILEVNSLPGMTPATCIFHQSAINGYKPYDFIDKILEYSLNKVSI